jgi:multidrug efflux pump subunit AcrA (membrane-fusion protein)
LYERAIPGKSYDAVVIFGFLALLSLVLSILIQQAAARNLSVVHRLLEASALPEAKPVIAALRSGATADAFMLPPTLLLILGLTVAHWSLLLVLLVLLAAIWATVRVGKPLVAQGCVASASLVAMAASAALTIGGQLSPGVLLSATFLIAAILRPAYAVMRALDVLAAAIPAWRALLRSKTLSRIAATPPVPKDADILMHAGSLTALIAASLMIYVPGSTVLQGLVAPDGHGLTIKSTVSARTQLVQARDGDHVNAGDPLVILDATEYRRQRDIIQEQITLEEAAIRDAAKDRAASVVVLERRSDAIASLVKKGLRPESDLMEAQLAQATEAKDWSERDYQRRSTLLRLRERIADTERALSALSIPAPRSGRVQQVEISAGMSVNPGDTLLTVVPDTKPIIEAKLEPVDRANVSEGMTADVRVRTSKQRYGLLLEAKVRTISADRFDDGTFRVVLVPSQALQIGAETEVVIKGQPLSAASWIAAVVSGSMRRAIQ